MEIAGNQEFPGILTRTFLNIQVTLLGNFLNKNCHGLLGAKLDKFPGIATWIILHFRVMIPGNQEFPGILTQKFKNFQVMIPGSSKISVYRYPEVKFCPPKFKTAIPPVKLKIYFK